LTEATRFEIACHSSQASRSTTPINGGLVSLAGCRKILSESFDMAQDERRRFEIVDDFPFMLRHSKHSEPFFSGEAGNFCDRIF
jgi:hypothetical protein